MEKIKIDYLIPILVTYNNEQYICFIDYAKSNVHFLTDVNDDIKTILYSIILKEINSNTLLDIKQPDIINNPIISQVISDINNDVVRSKFNNYLVKEENNE